MQFFWGSDPCQTCGPVMRKTLSPLKNSQQGVALYLTMVVLSIMSAAYFALTAILVSQIKITSGAGNSVLAFAAADAGIEEALYKVRHQDYSQGSFSGSLPSNGSIYTVTVTLQGQQTVAKSVGSYRTERRAIEIQF